METIEKTGFISEFTFELNESKDDANRVTFLRFTVTDDVAGMFNPANFVMSRDSAYYSDDLANQWKGLPFSSVQVGVVSALKDAYIHRKRLTATGVRPRSGAGRNHVELLRVTLTERSGPYIYQAPGPVARSRRARTTSRRRIVQR